MHGRDVVVIRANIEPARCAWVPGQQVVIVDERIPDAEVEALVQRQLRRASVTAAAEREPEH